MRLQSPVQFDAVTPQLENVVENMDGGVEIQLLGDFQQSLTPKCRGLGAPKTKYRPIAIKFIVTVGIYFIILIIFNLIFNTDCLTLSTYENHPFKI